MINYIKIKVYTIHKVATEVLFIYFQYILLYFEDEFTVFFATIRKQSAKHFLTGNIPPLMYFTLHVITNS